jgi:hypothetical protein
MCDVFSSQYNQDMATLQIPKNKPVLELQKLFTTKRNGFKKQNLTKVIIQKDAYTNVIMKDDPIPEGSPLKQKAAEPWNPDFIWQVDEFPVRRINFSPQDSPDSLRDIALLMATTTEYTAVISISPDHREIWYKMYKRDVHKPGIEGSLMYAYCQNVEFKAEGRIINTTIFVSIVQYYGYTIPDVQLAGGKSTICPQCFDFDDLTQTELEDASKIHIETSGYTHSQDPDQTPMPIIFTVQINRVQSENDMNVMFYGDGSENFYKVAKNIGSFENFLSTRLLRPSLPHLGVEWIVDEYMLLKICRGVALNKIPKYASHAMITAIIDSIMCNFK